MDDSVINLCDSDDDDNIDQTMISNKKFSAKKKYQSDDDDDSTSSSSSDDSHLWNAGGFLKGSPQRKGDDKHGIKATRKGNYFKEVRSKYNVGTDADGKNKKKRSLSSPKKKSNAAAGIKQNFDSPIVSLDIESESDYDEDEPSSKMAAVKGSDGNPRDKKRQLSPTSSSPSGGQKKIDFSPSKSSPSSSPNNKKSHSTSPKKKKPRRENNHVQKAVQEVECIEIDLSDDSSSDKDIDIDKKIDASKRSASTHPNVKSTFKHTQARATAKSNKYDKYDSDSDKSASSTEFQLQKKKPAAANKKPAYNPYKNNSNNHVKNDSDSDESDSSTDFQLQKKPAVAVVKKPAYNTYKNNINNSNNHATKKVQNNPCKKSNPSTKKKAYESSSDEDDNSSYSSDTTIPLAKDKMPSEMLEDDEDERLSETNKGRGGLLGSTNKKKNGKKGRVSFNNSDEIEHFVVNNDDHAEDGDFSFDGGYGGFDEDYNDDLPAKESTFKSLHQAKSKTKTPTKSKSALKSNDMDVLDIDSDDSSSSDSSAELFTPRPFKKKATTKPAAAYKSEEQHSASKSMEKKKCSNSATSASSKLLTPHAFSPATMSPTLGAYSVKLKVPTPAIPAMSASLVKEIGGKLYPDLRHNFLVVLTSHARRLRHNSYQRASFDSALRSVAVISLWTHPLRSAEAARRIKGVGSSFYDLLKESISGAKGKKPFQPAAGKFSCVAPAALVALLELEESSKSVASANGTSSFPLEDFLKKINTLLDPRANAAMNQSAEKYLDAVNLDPGFHQIKKLASSNAAAEFGGPFIKERKKKDACPSGRIYELLESGRELAKKLRQLANLGPAEPGPLRQLVDETVDEEFGQVTMSMDFREGGGGGKGLHRMCDQLDIRGVPYVVRELKIADYIFFVGDKLAPILIERKTAEDVASSLHDGRWERQKKSMRKAQFVLGGGPARRCQICYLIEGDATKKKVHGGNIGRRTWFQSLEDVESAIEQLPSQGFSVMKSKSHLDTTCILAKIAEDVSWKAKHGNIDANFTYKQFLSRVKVLGDEIGDPPVALEHQNPAPPVVTGDEHVPAAPSGDLEPDDNTFSPLEEDVPKKAQPKTSTAQIEENSEEYSQLKKMSIARLKEKCKERDEKIGGKKDDLIARLLKPRKPELLIMRARRGEYVPKVPSSNAALMVALLLHHVPGTQGLTKERLMVLAEETGVSKDSMSGDGGFYDGWSGMKQLQVGDPALVRKEKGNRYSLTTQPPESSGRAVAHALHIQAHRENTCNCGNSPE